MKLALLALPLAVLAVATPVLAADPAPAREVSIAFANKGGIDTWTAYDDDVIYLQDSRRRWYRVELNGTAPGLRSIQQLRFDTGATDTLDRFGAIYVGGQRYTFRSFEPVDGPPKRHEAKVKP